MSMDQVILGQLEELHFSPNEAKVYAALLEIGQTSAGEIIRKTQLHRSVVYETLDKLINKKFILRLKKRHITYFQSADPHRILEHIKTQEETARELVPKLKTLLNQKLPEITVYEGIESWRRFWVESTRNTPPNSVDYIAGSTGPKWQEYMGKEFKKYINLHIERKIKWKMIVFTKDPVELTLLKQYPTLHEYRLVDRNVDLDGNFNVIADQRVVLHSATEPMVIEVKNPTLVRVFRNLFDILWESGKEL